MAISDLKPVTKEVRKLTNKELEIQNQYYIDSELLQLESLKTDSRIDEFDMNGRNVKLQGIIEDFRVILDDKQVCEIVYGSVYHVNYELAKELLA